MNIILGPPGTGKTTRLLDLVEQYMESGVPPDRIGYFGFTRQAREEAVARACLRFGLHPSDLPYFRTLHSLAFLQVGATKEQLMGHAQYQEVADWLKVPPFWVQKSATGPFSDFGYGDKFLELIGIARITQRPLREVYNESEVRWHVDWEKVNYVSNGLRKWKDVYGLLDYTDLLELFVRGDFAPRLEVVFVDEAQDLSPIQWQMVRQLAAKADVTYVAGDDDQAIFRYAGADVNYFINLPGSVEILNQSYRIPASHRTLAGRVIRQVQNRRPKSFKPRDEEGVVRWYRNSEQVDLSEGEWLLLSRTRSRCKQLEEEVRSRGYLYTAQFFGAKGVSSDAMQAVFLWEELRGGGRLTSAQVSTLYKAMRSGVDVAHGAKGVVLEHSRLYTLEDLLGHGLLRTKATPWWEALGMIPEKDKLYLRSALRRGEKISNPRIRISTIHGAKGAQAENVVLLTDAISNPESKWRRNATGRDDEARVFYVGLTRAKHSLHLIQPMGRTGYPIPMRG